MSGPDTEIATEPEEASSAAQAPPGTSALAISLLHIITLFTLAVAHPLYDVLRHDDHAPFFFAHQSRAIDVWLLLLLLSFVIPAAVYLGLRLLDLLAPRTARILYAFSLTVLFFLFFVQIPGKMFAETGRLTVAFAVLASAVATLLYFRAEWSRTLISFMSVAAFLSPLLLLSSASVRSLLSTPEAAEPPIVRDRALPNVVMLVFDELPLLSLLDENRKIDPTRYPSFHRLAQSATWYRNTTTTHYATSEAIPSLLVGGEFREYLERVHGSRVASSGPMDRARVPASLFSLIESDYRVAAVELMTKLAPEARDSGPYVPPLADRMYELILDSAVLYAHVATPTRLRRFLPVIEGQWRGFLDTGTNRPSTVDWPYADSFSRASSIKQFIESLQKTNLPSFYFLHSLLPHYPFTYNERGQLHANKFSFMTMHFREASGINDWLDETTANLAYQAHLLQLSFTDILLGRILDKLVEVDLWDDSLVIVTSDHGTSFYWDSDGLSGTKLAEVQASGTLYVPLLIKLPGQVSGEVSDKPVKTIDIVPTIADVLGVEITWGGEGISVLDDAPQERRIRAALPEPREFGAIADADGLALKRKIELFGTHSFDGLYQVGPHKGLIGRPVAAFSSRTSTATVELNRPGQYQIGNPAGPRVPAYVEGRIQNLPVDLTTPGLAIAVAVNGVIQSTTRTTAVAISGLAPEKRTASQPLQRSDRDRNPADGSVHFLVRLPPQSFVRGANEVTVHAVLGAAPGQPVSLLDLSQK